MCNIYTKYENHEDTVNGRKSAPPWMVATLVMGYLSAGAGFLPSTVSLNHEDVDSFADMKMLLAQKNAHNHREIQSDFQRTFLSGQFLMK